MTFNCLVGDGDLVNKIKQLLKKIKKRGIVESLLFVLTSIGYYIVKPFYLLYLKNFTRVNNSKLLFMSNPNFSGNAKALYNYLVSQNLEYQFVWLFDNKGILLSDTRQTKFIKKNSLYHRGNTLLSLKEIATSKYLFFTHGSPMQEISKKPEQIIVNLWHGCGYKAVENREKAWIEENPFDFALVPGKLFVETKEKFWGCKGNQILPIGYPQYDFLLSESEQGEQYVKGIKKNTKKLILWMPTFRNTESGKYPEEKEKAQFDIPMMDNLEDMFLLDQILNKLQVTLCIKRHTYQLRYSCENQNFLNIKFISNDDLSEKGVELYSVLHYSDALISDYSSVAFDYLLLDKPIAFCLEDFEEYKNTRGFVFKNPLKYMPGHHLYSFDDLKNYIQDVCAGLDNYKEQRANVLNVAQNTCDNYSKRVWSVVQKLETSEIRTAESP